MTTISKLKKIYQDALHMYVAEVDRLNNIANFPEFDLWTSTPCSEHMCQNLATLVVDGKPICGYGFYSICKAQAYFYWYDLDISHLDSYDTWASPLLADALSSQAKDSDSVKPLN